jgi:L-2-hydroxyglutarate oxidase LhgO
MITDVLVIGGGVIGLSMGRHLAGRAKVMVIDKDTCGFHTSGRNSGVVHAGIYYTPGSAKAKYSVLGNKALTSFCKEKGVALENIGKIIAPNSPEEYQKIDFLFERSIQNGAPVKIIDYHEAREIEPRIVRQDKYLWSPSTSIADNKGVIQALKDDCLKSGVDIREMTKYLGYTETGWGNIVETSQGKVYAKYVINCAGLYADKVAHDFGFGLDYEILPFIGLYLYGRPGVPGFKTLVYPCPLGKNEFLGVHTTNNTRGEFMLGPTATPAFWREQYSLKTFNFFESIQSIRRYLMCLLSPSRPFYMKLLKQEIRKYNKKNIVADVGRIVHGIYLEDYLTWGPSAIFPQLVSKKSNELIGDFLIERNEKSLHFINIVSPGWTSALAFTKDVADSINLN